MAIVDEKRLSKRWKKLCADVAAEARSLGAKEPFIFACESGLCVLDGPPKNGALVLFTLVKPPSSIVDYDAGAW